MSSPFVLVNASSTVAEITARYPATAPVFHLMGLDTCCRAHLTLRDAAEQARTDLAVLLSTLEASACASLRHAGTE